VRPYGLFLICFLAVAFGALNSVLSSSYLPDIVRSLAPGADEANRGAIGAWINFGFLIGGALGGIAMGFLSDRIGRRTVLALALLCYGIGSGAGALASNWQLLTWTRVLVGVGVGTALVVSAVMIAEAWEARTRAIALGILSVAYPVGIIASGMVTTLLTNWRYGLGLGAMGALLAVPVLVFVRDAVRSPSVAESSRLKVLGTHRRVLCSGMLVYGTMLIGIWAAFSWLPTWVQSLLDNTLGDAASNGQSARGLSFALLGGGGLVGGIASGWVGNTFGLRRVQAACFVLSFVLSYLLFEVSASYTRFVEVGIACLGICFGVSQGILNTYIPELFPATVRSAATALCFHVGRIFTAAAVFFVGALVVWFDGYGRAIFAFSLVYVVGLLAMYVARGTQVTLESN
jgi:MFS family permease